MKTLIKKTLALIGLYHPSFGVKISQGRKAEILLSYKAGKANFIETGTHQGGMIEAMKQHFENIYSVELDDKLYDEAAEKFKGEKNVHLYQGDSAVKIREILECVTTPSLFWLDAHGSGEITFTNSPIESELRMILASRQKHTIVIDDARHFNHNDIGKIKKMARQNNYRCVINDGLFHLLPQN